MTPEQKQLLRINILRQLEIIRRGLPLGSLHDGAKHGGFNVPATVVEETLEWLIGKGYASETRADYSDIVRIWKITDAGLELLDK